MHAAAGNGAPGKTRTGRNMNSDPVSTEDPPVPALEIPGDEVPASAGGHEMVGFYPPAVCRACTCGGACISFWTCTCSRSAGIRRAGTLRIVEPQHFPGTDGSGQGQQDPGRRLSSSSPARRKGRETERVEAAAQTGGHHLANGRQGTACCLLNIRSRGGCALQRDGERDHLVIVEKKRRKLGSGVEPVTAVRSLHRADGVPQFPESVHVAADSAVADVQALGQDVAGPLPARLQKGEQHQQPRSRRRHVSDTRPKRGQKQTSTGRTVGVTGESLR